MADILTGAVQNRFSGKTIDLANTAKSLVKDHLIECWFPSSDGVTNLKLDIIGDEVLTADCDVTDHYVESNEPRQDQVALKPKTYSVSGEVGELVWYQKDSVSQGIGQVAQRLEGVISFLPIRTKSFNQMKNKVMKAAQWVDTASNAVSRLSSLFGRVSGIDATTSQQQAYLYLTQFRDNRQLCTLKTPWGILNSYIIANLEFRQPKETKDKTLISITFKEFRVVQMSLTPFDPQKYQGNAAFDNQPKQDQGKSQGKDISISETVDAGDLRVTGVNMDGTAERAAITVDMTDGQKKYTVFYETGFPKSSSEGITVIEEGGKVIHGIEKTPYVKASENVIKQQIDRSTKGFVQGD